MQEANALFWWINIVITQEKEKDLSQQESGQDPIILNKEKKRRIKKEPFQRDFWETANCGNQALPDLKETKKQVAGML